MGGYCCTVCQSRADAVFLSVFDHMFVYSRSLQCKNITKACLKCRSELVFGLILPAGVYFLSHVEPTMWLAVYQLSRVASLSTVLAASSTELMLLRSFNLCKPAARCSTCFGRALVYDAAQLLTKRCTCALRILRYFHLPHVLSIQAV